MIFPLKTIEFEGEQFYVMNELEKFLDGHYWGKYMNFPMNKQLLPHNYMFQEEQLKHIDDLYEKFVCRAGKS